MIEELQRKYKSIGVSEIHILERAMANGCGNDLALLKLSRPAPLSNTVGLAYLANGNLMSDTWN